MSATTPEPSHTAPSTSAELSLVFCTQHHLLLLPSEAGDAQPTLLATPATPAAAIGEALRQCAGRAQVRRVSATELERHTQQRLSASQTSAQRVVAAAEQEVDLSLLMQQAEHNTTDLLAAEDDAPIIRILNALLLQAAREGASDIHIEAAPQHSSVRLRVDGTMREIARPRRELHQALISRLKIMASLDIAESRLPQDGRISTRLGARMIDIRVSTLPNAHGERAVLRLLDKSASRLSLAACGMPQQTFERFDALIHRPHGLVLVTGPTGSGKTTTLYSALAQLDATQLNILTVEDPIEYELPGIGQTPINAKIGLSFAHALRSILRQDPDVVMVGEIRDAETAAIAIQASLTGHLVLATLHTNDAASAVTRLVDMGVEPYLLAGSLLGVLAQRLVRRIDPQASQHNAQPIFRGRTGIYELLCVDAALRELIHGNASEADIRSAAIAQGMQTMREHGMTLVAQGITTQQEVLLATAEQ